MGAPSSLCAWTPSFLKCVPDFSAGVRTPVMGKLQLPGRWCSGTWSIITVDLSLSVSRRTLVHAEGLGQNSMGPARMIFARSVGHFGQR